MRLSDFIPTLLAPPGRVLEVGCGAGELAHRLAETGYDVLAIDPDAPDGPIFRRVTLEDFDESGPFDLAVADRVLHHVHPLAPALRKLSGLAPLLVVDEFAWEQIDAGTQAWYEGLHRRLENDGREPKGPADLDQWRLDHPGMHPSEAVLGALAEQYEQRHFERRPYFYRWLGLPEVEESEQVAIDAGEIRPIGYRWVGSV